jgi:hypothetical protein
VGCFDEAPDSSTHESKRFASPAAESVTRRLHDSAVIWTSLYFLCHSEMMRSGKPKLQGQLLQKLFSADGNRLQ